MNKDIFISECKKVNNTRKHKATHSFGIYNFFKDYRKNKPKDPKYNIEEKQYSYIINSINSGISDLLSIGISVTMPCNFGTFEVRKHEVKPKIDSNGKLKINAPVDWEATFNLWYEDEEAKQKKTLVRTNEKFIYRIKWNKKESNIINIKFFKFKTSRPLKLSLKGNIKKNILKEAYLIHPNYGI